MATKFKPRVYNDGVCKICTDIETKSTFGAQINSTKESDYEQIYRLMFAEVSIREQDFEFAESRGRTITRKIKTPLVKNVNSRQKVIIGDMLYSIINADIDRKNDELYLYLEEECELDTTGTN